MMSAWGPIKHRIDRCETLHIASVDHVGRCVNDDDDDAVTNQQCQSTKERLY